MSLMSDIIAKAKARRMRIALPEGSDERTLRAARILTDGQIAEIILLGQPDKLNAQAKTLGFTLDGIEIVEPVTSAAYETYVDEYVQLRQHKGMTRKEALEVMKDTVFFAAMMVRNGIAHGAVSGAANTTAHVMRAGIQCVGVAEGFKTVSSFFMMILPEFRGEHHVPYFFADAALVPNPDASQLADIAIATADNWKALVGTDPNVAMLSFSTKGSATHPDVDKVIEATQLIHARRPDLNVDGELQFDAAVIPSIGERKSPGSPVAGHANVLIFPDLDAGNIAYKITQRFGKAEAIGPFVQGLNRSFNDLSRGCSTEDIVNTVAVAAVISQAQA
ncbi:MAG: phosphate acetyltransferase [Gemmatimonadetes bacterium]|nr:MAG: phosphate acetyltransferase [Gemmatimonadota bacterium]